MVVYLHLMSLPSRVFIERLRMLPRPFLAHSWTHVFTKHLVVNRARVSLFVLPWRFEKDGGYGKLYIESLSSVIYGFQSSLQASFQRVTKYRNSSISSYRSFVCRELWFYFHIKSGFLSLMTFAVGKNMMYMTINRLLILFSCCALVLSNNSQQNQFFFTLKWTVCLPHLDYTQCRY